MVGASPAKLEQPGRGSSSATGRSSTRAATTRPPRPTPQSAGQSPLPPGRRRASTNPEDAGGASVPALAPELPEGYEESTPSRLALLHEAKHVALSDDFGGCRKISLRGTGGVGKTTLATSLVRDVDMLAGFEVAAWVTVGETPDLVECARSALKQLGSSDAAELDEVVQRLRSRMARRDVLLVLDDVWESDHAQLLCALDETTRSVCLVSTRLSRCCGKPSSCRWV